MDESINDIIFKVREGTFPLGQIVNAYQDLCCILITCQVSAFVSSYHGITTSQLWDSKSKLSHFKQRIWSQERLKYPSEQEDYWLWPLEGLATKLTGTVPLLQKKRNKTQVGTADGKNNGIRQDHGFRKDLDSYFIVQLWRMASKTRDSFLEVRSSRPDGLERLKTNEKVNCWSLLCSLLSKFSQLHCFGIRTDRATKKTRN